jgi:regulator of nucleoside diphosphate kinase
MEAVMNNERTLTELDHVRLTKLIHKDPRAVASAASGSSLADLLDVADLVPSRTVSPDIVTMYSQVSLADLASGRKYKLTLCYPSDAEPAAGFVSVFSPVGASLLGLRVGCVARWRAPNGEENAAAIEAVLFQPEGSGDYTT